ncbi:MAG: acyltransferase family protein [Nitrososphaerales archaeon]
MGLNECANRRDNEVMLNPQSGRIPCLDGLRAISITLVLILHLGIPYYVIPSGIFGYISLGHLGVMIFFTISGYLITGLLLRELESDGRINLIRFYFRRTLRIFPPYYFLVLVYIIAIQAIGWIQLAPREAVHMLTYTSNYYPERVWEASHFWSLAVEEQFYLLWPATLLLLGKRWGLWAALLLILLCPLLRTGFFHLFPEMLSDIRYRTEMCADSIAVGCLLAGKHELLKLYPLARKLHIYSGFQLSEKV